MRRTTIVAIGAALLLAGCGGSKVQEAYVAAAAATADATVAKGEVAELQEQVTKLENRVTALEARLNE